MIVTDWLPQDKFLQLIPLDRSLKQTQEQDIYTQTRNFQLRILHEIQDTQEWENSQLAFIAMLSKQLH